MRITVRCRGEGCPFTGTAAPARGRRVRLAGLFQDRWLRTRTVIEIRVVQPGRTTKLYRYRTRGNQQRPRGGSSCLPDGAARPVDCDTIG